MSKPTLTEFEIAVRSEAMFHAAASVAPVGSEAERAALVELEQARNEVKRVRTGILEYHAALEAAVMSYRGDRRRQ